MNVKSRLLLVLPLFLIGILNGFTQDSSVDSLKDLLSTAKDTNRVTILNTLAFDIRSNDPEQALQYAKQALDLARDLEFEKGIAFGLNNIGAVYYVRGSYEKAIDYYNQSLKGYKELEDVRGVLNCLNNLGVVYKDQGDFEKSISSHLRALKIREELEDKKGVTSSLNNIGAVYYYLGNYDMALDNFLKALAIFEELEDKKRIAHMWGNIGVVYTDQGNYEKAIDYLFWSLEADEERGNKMGMAEDYTNIGIAYHYQGLYYKAIDFYNRSLKLNEELGAKRTNAITLNSISESYLKLGDTEKALAHLYKSLTIAKEIGAKSEMKEAYKNLAKAYADKNQYKKAYEHHQEYTGIKDSLFNEEKSRQIVEMQTKYDTEKKEKENEILKKENALQEIEAQKSNFIKNLALNSSGVLFVALIIFIVIYLKESKKNKRLRVVIRRYKRSTQELGNLYKEYKKYNKDKKADIKAEKNLIDRIEGELKVFSNYLRSSMQLIELSLKLGEDDRVQRIRKRIRKQFSEIYGEVKNVQYLDSEKKEAIDKYGAELFAFLDEIDSKVSSKKHITMDPEKIRLFTLIIIHIVALVIFHVLVFTLGWKDMKDWTFTLNSVFVITEMIVTVRMLRRGEKRV